MFLVRAHEAKPDCDVAARAAHALRLSGSDLTRATELAKEAVAMAPRNAAYRATLAETYLAAGSPERAEEECAEALALAPKDERIRALAAKIAKGPKSKES